MSVYYNEHDPYAAQWLRNLIAAGHIATGVVDERSITEVQPADLAGFRQCHFFAGIGVWSYALRLAGWDDDRPVWTGSCPCQPFSAAGQQAGGDDPRHLWPAWFRLVRECRPPVVFGEQVASAIGHGWLDLVSSDMEREGYAVGSVVLGAHSVGAPHIRQRLWFVGDSSESGFQGRRLQPRKESGQSHSWQTGTSFINCTDGLTRPTQPGLSPLAHGATSRVGRLRAYGNAICAPTAAEFVSAFMTTGAGGVLAAPCGAKDQEQVATQARSPEREKEREKEEKQPRSRSDVDPPGFQEFWNAYPRKVGKGAARRAWSKLHGKQSEILPAALASLAWQRVSPDWTKESGAFIPHPATYLNQERWTDQPLEKPPDPFLTWVEEESLARH